MDSIIPDHTDGAVIQYDPNNVDACTHCAYLIFLHCEVGVFKKTLKIYVNNFL